MLYIIGPMTFQMIVIGLILQTLGVNYDSITNKRHENKEEQEQASA
jgi:hypothetical protein